MMKFKNLIPSFLIAIFLTAILFGLAPSDSLNINDNKFMITDDGGIAFPFINKTGAPSVKGNLVEPHSDANSIELTDADSLDPIGVIYNSGVPDGSMVWVVMYGKAKVLLDEDTGSTAGNWVEASEAGYADATQAGPPGAVLAHFQEIGHCIETVSAGGVGTHVLCTIIIHFL
jgi:hypothetical protein